MNKALHVSTRVGPGNKIEISDPELVEGESVEVFVVARHVQSPTDTRSALDVIQKFREQRPPSTREEVDAYLQEERDAWDR